MVPFAGVDTAQLLQDALRVTELNQKLIAGNIANADTPNYNPARLDFKATLRSAVEGRGTFQLRGTDPRHFDVTRALPEFRSLAILSKNDYNKVDMEEEMTELAKNTGRYTIYSSLLTKRFRQHRDMLSNIR
jgi:flagellar basal-body rod protein FlgB